MKKFPKIGQYRQVVKSLKLQQQYRGKDEDGNPIYDSTAELSPVTFIGRVKLHGCVSGDTLVTMADGSECPISELRIGDSILSFNTEKMLEEFDIVTNVISDDLSKKWLKLTFSNGSSLECTEDHPIFTKNRGYIKAKELLKSDVLISF